MSFSYAGMRYLQLKSQDRGGGWGDKGTEGERQNRFLVTQYTEKVWFIFVQVIPTKIKNLSRSFSMMSPVHKRVPGIFL